MSAADANSTVRRIGDALGVVQRRFADNDPPVVGTQVVSADPHRGFEVRFLLATERDVARGADEDLLRRLKQAFADALARSGATAPVRDVRVTVSSLEAQGIRRSTGADRPR